MRKWVQVLHCSVPYLVAPAGSFLNRLRPTCQEDVLQYNAVLIWTCKSCSRSTLAAPCTAVAQKEKQTNYCKDKKRARNAMEISIHPHERPCPGKPPHPPYPTLSVCTAHSARRLLSSSPPPVHLLRHCSPSTPTAPSQSSSLPTNKQC